MCVDNVDLGNGIKAARMQNEPGWKWSECIKPMKELAVLKKSHRYLCKKKSYGNP